LLMGHLAVLDDSHGMSTILGVVLFWFLALPLIFSYFLLPRFFPYTTLQGCGVSSCSMIGAMLRLHFDF
jgi:predicted permease